MLQFSFSGWATVTWHHVTLAHTSNQRFRSVQWWTCSSYLVKCEQCIVTNGKVLPLLFCQICTSKQHSSSDLWRNTFSNLCIQLVQCDLLCSDVGAKVLILSTRHTVKAMISSCRTNCFKVWTIFADDLCKNCSTTIVRQKCCQINCFCNLSWSTSFRKWLKQLDSPSAFRKVIVQLPMQASRSQLRHSIVAAPPVSTEVAMELRGQAQVLAMTKPWIDLLCSIGGCAPL